MGLVRSKPLKQKTPIKAKSPKPRKSPTKGLNGAASWSGLAIPKRDTMARKAAPEGCTGPELDLQKQAEEYLAFRSVQFVRIPDSILGWIAGNAPTWLRVFVSTYWRGVPDLILIVPAKGGGYNHCHLIELKTATGKLSQGQKNWHSKANVSVLRSWPEVKESIDTFLDWAWQ